MLGLEPQIDDDVLLTATVLGKYSHIQAHSVLHQCTVGDYSYCAGYNQLYYTELGKFCSLASFVRINPGNHPTYQRIAQHHFTYRRENAVKIGHDVWIGHNACVMPGITIGNGAVIGSGAIVTKDVEPYTVVVGVPSRPIKKRFPEDVIEKLETLRWWDWDHETLRECLPYFRDFTAFKAKFLS